MASWTQKVTAPQFDRGELPPEDTHLAVCVAVMDLGSHTEDYQGTEKTVRKLFLVWELVGLEKGHVIGKDFNRSLHEKSTLRKWLSAWRGKDFADNEEFDYSKLLGKACQLQVTHRTGNKDRVFPQAAAILKCRAGEKVPSARYPFVLWSVEDDQPFPADEWLPSHLYGTPLKEWAESCHERRGRPAKPSNGNGAQSQQNPDADDASPF